MGIDVRIITESEQELALLLDPENLTAKLLPELSDNRFHCLRFIDPYGDTVFNQLQIPILITEIEEMVQRVSDQKIKLHGMAILKLAHQARQGVHQYLKFYGD